MSILVSFIFCSCVIVSMKEGQLLLRTIAPVHGPPTTTDPISSHMSLSILRGSFPFPLFLFALQKELVHLVPWTDSFARVPLMQQRCSMLPASLSIAAILVRFAAIRDPRGTASRRLSHLTIAAARCFPSIFGVEHAFHPSFPPFAARHPHHRPPAVPAVSPAATKAR